MLRTFTRGSRFSSRLGVSNIIARTRSSWHGDTERLSSGYQPVLTAQTMNPHLVQAQYAVRGLIPTKAAAIAKELKQEPTKYPFDSIVYCNIGNPQALGQRPITYFRQVLSLLEFDDLYNACLSGELPETLFPKDVVERARRYRENGALLGAYSESQGLMLAREEVAAYLAERDGVPASPDDIFLTSGASEGVANLLEALIASPDVGIMIPVPQYPLYSATITKNNGTAVHYYLDEGDNWGMSVAELKEQVMRARQQGVDVRALCVINPGNPTGQCLSRESIENIIQFCYEENIMILADEVYQTNAYLADFPFHSFKKVLCTMPEMYRDVELVSFHSLSKGMIGECGRRGGFMELTNITEDAREQLIKRASINLCSNVASQVMTGMMCNPPQPGEASYELYNSEMTQHFDSLRRRAFRLAAAFNHMEGITCNPPMGAMYLFPRIQVSERAAIAAAREGLPADTFYCLKLLEKTGVCVVPGTGFEQQPGTFHFRCTFLPGEEAFDSFIESIQSFQKEWVSEYGL